MNTLPKLDTPTYTLKIPSTGDEVTYRPYVVKEEMILLNAAESKDEQTIIREILRLVDICTYDKLDLDSLTLYDLEYIFIKLRSVSVGEKSTVLLKCEKDQIQHEYEIDLRDIKLVWPEDADQEEMQKKIMLSDTIGITVSHIPATALRHLSSSDKSTDTIMKLIACCVVDIFSKDGVWRKEDVTQEEILEFISQFTNTQLNEIQKFVGASPELQYTAKWKCLKCGHQNEITLRGIADFF